MKEVRYLPWAADMRTAAAVARACGALVETTGATWEFVDRRVTPPRVSATYHGGVAPRNVHKWVRRLLGIYAETHPGSAQKSLLEVTAGAEYVKLEEEAARKRTEEATVGAPMTDEHAKAKKQAVARIFSHQERLKLTDYDLAILLGIDVKTVGVWKQGGNSGAKLSRLEEWVGVLASMDGPPLPKPEPVKLPPPEPIVRTVPTAPGAVGEATPAIMDGRLTLKTTVPVTYRADVAVVLALNLRDMEASELLALQVQVNTEVMRRVKGANL